MAAGLGSGPRVRAFLRRPKLSRARDEAQHGFTLVEILITVWILGALMVAFMGGLVTMMNSSEEQRRVSTAETELRRFAESVRDYPYEACWTASQYDAAVKVGYTSPAGFTPSVSSITYWNEAADVTPMTPTEPQTFVSSHPNCDGTLDATDDGLQQLTISMQVTGTPGVQLNPLVILKRDNQNH
jgi:prepilin-type N-terminal cleavage/methylation domain-containing protein